MKEKITININKNTDISKAIKKAMGDSEKKYKTIQPSNEQSIQSTQEGTFNALLGNVNNIAG
ncbi:MAG: hypothetical protein DRQ78_02720 [Epsilonproteobacteria bacterium]|nr:MAG: hypothetical protein DRQ78_02720 [Campylobacterota bacterium]